MGKLFCKHEWVMIEKPQHIRFKPNMAEVVKCRSICSLCGREKNRVLSGYQTGNVFVEAM